ncbi:DUF4231 domain-containing protein [Streptomyces sp. NPDC058461]|uniref:DUF4231 domain-containing protein n=1 Tax=Streptomyces sp. NPDC058461 TaxID=3346509 RepID=UPI00365317C4
MDTVGGTAVVEDVWRVQSIWSQAADRSRTRVTRARAIALTATVTSAALGATAQLMPQSPLSGRICSFVALLAAGAVPLAARGAAADRVRQWTRLRSVSEELKSQVYVYLARLAEYRPPAGRDAELLRRTDRISAEADDLVPALRGIGPTDRPLPPVTGAADYVTGRLRRQLEGYYRPRAEDMARRGRRVERWGVALAALSALLGAAAGAFAAEEAAAWIPVVAAVSAAVVSHGAAARYAALEIQYGTTAGELERVLRWWRGCDPATDADGDLLALRVEDIVSDQNAGWMAKWTAD